MKLYFFALLLVGVLYSCQQEPALYYPPRDAEMTEALYNKYKALLDSAYAQDNWFTAGFQLANLKAPPEKVFEYVNKGIRRNSGHCIDVFDYYNLYRNDNFRMNLVKSDTNRFEAAFQLCQDILGENAYSDFLAQKEADYQEYLARRTKLDSTKFDYTLIKKLDQILEDDQKIRMEVMDRGISEGRKTELWEQQMRLDSVNLGRVDQILENGYPTKELVGYDHVKTVWLVLQHQGDPEIRRRYLPFLEKAVDDGILADGLLEMYKKRDEHIKLEGE